MKVVFKKLNIPRTHFLHFGCGIGPIEMEIKQIKTQYIKNIGNWKPDAQDEFYLYKIPIKTMKVMVGASENHEVHYNPRTVPKPPEELQRLIFHSFRDPRLNSMI